MAADLLNERLPPDWSYGVTGDGRVFFINERHQETSWLHPVTGRPVQTGHQAAPGLPNGWEQDYTLEGVTYFIDHNNFQTSFCHPVTGRPVSEENPPPPPSSPPQSPTDRAEFRRGPNSTKQRSIKAPSAKRNPTAQVVRRGFLYRLESGGISKAWKRRWCVLTDFALFIYKTDDEKVTLGSVLLPSYRINRCSSDDPIQKEFAFKVEHENTKTIYFHTDTQTDLDSWLSNLQMAATMKGTGGFYREANNNIKPGGPVPRSPPRGDHRPYGDHAPSPTDPGLHFHPQWKNPNPSAQHQHSPGRGPPQSADPGPPSWRSVPDLEANGGRAPRMQEAEPDPHGSLRSLPAEGHAYPGFPGHGLQPDSRNYAHHQSYDPRLVRPRMEDKDPRGSVRSLQPDPYKHAQDFVPLGQSRAAERDRGSYTQPGFRPFQRPDDPQQRLSMVSNSSRRGDPHGQGSPQRSPRDPNTSQGSMDNAYRPSYYPEDGRRNQGFPPNSGGPGIEGGAPGRERGSWQTPHPGPGDYAPQYRDSMANSDTSRGHPAPNRGYPERPHPETTQERDGRFYADSHPRLNASQDPRASYASSRHSMASQGYRGDRDNQGSKQNLFLQHGSRNSLSRVPPPSSYPPPPSHHAAAQDTHSHTYVNVPEMRGTGQPFEEPLAPERPPYPAAVRDQLVRDMAEARSPGSGEQLLIAHELNKERMQRTPFFQYPTPPRDHTASRVEDAGSSEAGKRLSQYSDRNSLASNSAMRTDPLASSAQPQRAPVRDYSDGGRRQDSGSGRFSDSFERHSGRDAGNVMAGRGVEGVREAPVPEERRFGGDPEAKTLRQAYERVQTFRQSSAAGKTGQVHPSLHLRTAAGADVNFFEYSLNSQLSSGMYVQPDKTGYRFGYGSLPRNNRLKVHGAVDQSGHGSSPRDSRWKPQAAMDRSGYGSLPRDMRLKPNSTVNQFGYGSLPRDNRLKSHSTMDHSGYGSLPRDTRLKPQAVTVSSRTGEGPTEREKDDLNASQATTLSPCGSYHHIDQDLEQLYQRGSAFRPPSSVSASSRGESQFHSLPQSYKFKSAQRGEDAGKTARPAAEKADRMGQEVDGGMKAMNGDWEWYKAHYLSPQHPENQPTIEQAGKSRQQRSVSDLGFTPRLREKRREWPVDTEEEVREFTSLVRSEGPVLSHPSSTGFSGSGKEAVNPGFGGQSEPLLQSWPRCDLTSRELDVPTPSSLSSHPFFVPEEATPLSSHPQLPAGKDSDNDDSLTPRSRLDKALREDLDEGIYATLKAREGMNRRPIQTVREEPDMPDNEVLETRLKKKYPLNGTRLRMSISAGDLIGKTHDELVLLLIQLRRNQAALGKARDFYCESLGKKRPIEREYRKQRHDSVGRLERSLEEGHQSFVDIRSQLEEVEKKLEVYRPLINLVDNMVTMGSLYGGDNLMLATQYRKHLLRPDQYQPPRKLLEFSRQHQEDRVITGIQNDVRQLTATEVDLEEKIDRLNQLERLLQEQSFKVSSFREDKELLEKALAGILRQLGEGQDSPREQRHLQQQQMSVDKELSRVTQELAEASKALEKTTVENNKIEHEVALLRTKVHGELKRSKSAPSLGTDNANNKVKMERELARVQNMLQGLSQQGEKLSQQMSTIRRSSSGTQLAAAFDEAEKSRKAGTYLQTDLDSGEQVDLAQQIPVSPPHLSTSLSPTSPDTPGSGVEREPPLISHQRQESTLGIPSDGESRADWDIGDADDNTKRFYGLLPKERPRSLTVRDVKRQSEQRRERKRDDDGQDLPLRVSSTDDDSSSFLHARYPSYGSSQSSGLDLSGRDPSAPLYENLPRSGSMPSLNQNGSAPSSRRSSINLMAPKPFTPYQDKTAKPFRSELSLISSERPGDLTADSSTFTASKPFTSEVALNSWEGSPGGYPATGSDSVGAGQSLTHDFSGHAGLVTARPFQLSGSADNLLDLPQTGGARSSLPVYSRGPQPFRRDYSGVSQSTPHLNTMEFTPSSPPAFSSVTRPVLEGGNTSRVYAPRPWAKERAELQPGLYDVKKTSKGRYMTVSSSQPTTLEPEAFDTPSLRSAAGEPMSNGRVDNVPDVVKSSLTNVDKIDQMDQDMIDREILHFPEKVLIPERYDPEADAEQLTESEKMERREKAERIKRVLANQSVLSTSQPDVNHMPPGQFHRQLEQEKEERAHILTLNQELARQVTQRSKRAAVERRKTWSGGQIADIKAQYEAEMMGNPTTLDSLSRTSRQAYVLL